MSSEQDLREVAQRRLDRARQLRLETARTAQAGGRVRYVVLRGVLQYGSLFLLLLVGSSYAFSREWSPLGIEGGLERALLRGVVLSPVAALLGVAVASMIWRRLERVWFPRLVNQGQPKAEP